MFSTRTESCYSANKSSKGCWPCFRIWTPVQKGYNPNWIPTLAGQQTTNIDICFPQWWWSELSLFSHCWLPVVDPSRQLFPWIHRGRGQQRGYIQKRMYEQDQRSAVGSTPYLLDLVPYPHCTHIMTIKVQLHNSTFLPHVHHMAERVSQPESSKEPRSENYARDQHQTNHGDAWPAEQILALSAASSGMVCP